MNIQISIMCGGCSHLFFFHAASLGLGVRSHLGHAVLGLRPLILLPGRHLNGPQCPLHGKAM